MYVLLERCEDDDCEFHMILILYFVSWGDERAAQACGHAASTKQQQFVKREVKHTSFCPLYVPFDPIRIRLTERNLKIKNELWFSTYCLENSEFQ